MGASGEPGAAGSVVLPAGPRLGVLGWPVAHSRSPAMQNAALAHLGLAAEGWRYQKLPVPPELFAETVRALPDAGFVGANVTIPHKEAALALADELTPAARQIGAANTLTFDAAAGTIHADNTDAPGFIRAIQRDHHPAGSRALVWGAGGSARAVVFALLQAGAAEVRVWNRTALRAEELCASVGGRPINWEDASRIPFDISVNCTALGLDTPNAELKQLPLHADGFRTGTLIVDMVYRSGGTALLRAARAAGADTVDGLDILVEQGAASLERWTGKAAPRRVMREAAG